MIAPRVMATDVYFDMSIISAIAKRDTPDETEAILRVLRAGNAGRLSLCTSEVSKEEMEKYYGEFRPTVEAIYLLMKKANYVNRQELNGMNVQIDKYTCINSPMIEDNPLWLDLLRLGLKALDAHQLTVAIRNACHVFLTSDRDFLIKERKATIETRYGIRLRRPSELVNEEGL